MYSVRNIIGSTMWQCGIFSSNLGYYRKSQHYKHEYIMSGMAIDEFYEKVVKIVK